MRDSMVKFNKTVVFPVLATSNEVDPHWFERVDIEVNLTHGSIFRHDLNIHHWCLTNAQYK